jgi:transposase InsO family protein
VITFSGVVSRVAPVRQIGRPSRSIIPCRWEIVVSNYEDKTYLTVRGPETIVVDTFAIISKYEDVYLKEYATVPELATSLTDYFSFYNEQRPHQSLDYRTPAEVHFA